MRAEGGEDEGGMGVSSIKVNGEEHCPRKVGHNVVVLDPIGEVVAAKNFNTNAGEGPALGQFLDQLPEDHVVLVATQGVNGREQGMLIDSPLKFNYIASPFEQWYIIILSRKRGKKGE